MKMLSEKSVLLCRQGSCCPIVTLENKKVNIKDDFGGKISISLEEAEMISDALEVLKSKQKQIDLI